MQQSNPILLNQLKQDYIALQQLGSPLLACQGMFVPRGMEDLRFLFKSCPRPIVSNEDQQKFNMRVDLLELLLVPRKPITQATFKS